jgi:ABC-type dipeptide/oligopeptide/nickel transport system permease component
VLPAIISHLPQTIELALAGMVAQLLIAFAPGTLAARAGGWVDRGLLALCALPDRLDDI